MKNLMAIAGTSAVLAAIPAGVQAQSNVTISGYLDQGIYRNFDGVKNVGTIQRSNLAFSGKEDLGGGLSAIFRFSTRFDMDNGTQEGVGNKPFWHDESTIGLQGAFGKIRIGRGLTALWSQDWGFDAWYNFNRIASPAWQFWHYLTPTDRTSANGKPEYGRLNSGIFYDSPSFSGVTVHLSGTPVATTAPGGGRDVAASLVYAKDTFGAMLASERNGSGDKDVFVAAKYGFGSLTVNGAYDVSKKAGTTLEAKVATVSASYGMGQTTLKAGYGRLDLSGAKTGFIGLGAEYALSRRTMVYASLGNNRPDAGSTTTAYGVGIAHAF